MATQLSHSIDLEIQNEIADELAGIAQRAREITNAEGAAIAAGEGNPERMLCRASSGPNAPDVGTTVQVEGTFTGICIESGKELLCDDAETDARVDAAAARALGIRSILVTPIQEETQISGVLAVFAAAPHAFSNAHVAPLKTLADQVSAALHKERRPIAEKPIEPSVHPGPAVLKMIIPITADRSNVAQAGRVILSSEFSDEGKGEEKPATVGLLPAKLAKLNGNRLMVISAIAVVLAVLVSGVVLLKRGNRVSSTAPYPPQEGRQAVLPAPPNDLASKPVPEYVSANAKTEVVEDGSNGLESRKSEKPEGRHLKQPAVSVLSPGSTGKLLPSPTEREDVAPDLSIGQSSATNLSLLAQPRDRLPFTIGSSSGLVQAKVTHVVNPIYPNIAKTSRVAGTITLQVVVGKDGKTTNLKFIRGPILFRNAAFDAVRQWTFQPATLHGRPVEQEMQVTLDFQP